MQSSKVNNTVPNIGTHISLDTALIHQDCAQSTPMTKMRFIDGQWRQVAKAEAGMYVFFLAKPMLDHCCFVIRSIIPSGAACYAHPM